VTAPPRLLVRTLTVTFLAVALILSVVFIVLTIDVRERVRTAETEKLQVGERMFTALEARYQRNQLATIATLAENPTLKAALDTYDAERQFADLGEDQEAELRRTVAREAEKLAAVTDVDALAILDSHGQVFVSAGRLAERWTQDAALAIPAMTSSFEGVVVLPAGPFRVAGAPLSLIAPGEGTRNVGMLVLATSLDERYAQQLASLARAGIVIAAGNSIVGSTIPDRVARALLASTGNPVATRTLDGEEYAVRMLLASDHVRIYMLASVDQAAGKATRSALLTLGAIAFGSFVLAGLGSLWLARTLSEPIDRTSSAIATMTAARDFGRRLEPTGTSRELDALTTAFNELMRGITAAEADTRAAYLGAIRALAAALDARDPYTAGHSERVSALSVLIARQMQLSEEEIDIIRLGALLHDVGKIGVRDSVLRKPGPLTPDEYDQIKLHPTLGARILREVPFLAPHLPIVELHHEQPDGRGYPHGLTNDDIPLAAHIVHVADTFDAMTSARAYRPARPASIAFAELHKFSGTQFDPASVEALCVALPAAAPATAEPELLEILGRTG
jgi:putative nucleotidyltransferase with HDIG domain